MSLFVITCSHFNLSMMEIYQVILMVIGAVATIYLIVKFVKGFFWILGKGMESCFREKYPYDFEINLKWVANHNNNTAIVMQDSASDENKKLLSKYLD